MIFGSKGGSDDDRVKELEAENKRLREALEFYANPDHWKDGHKYRDADDATIFEDEGTSGISADMGSVALRALKGK